MLTDWLILCLIHHKFLLNYIMIFPWCACAVRVTVCVYVYVTASTHSKIVNVTTDSAGNFKRKMFVKLFHCGDPVAIALTAIQRVGNLLHYKAQFSLPFFNWGVALILLTRATGISNNSVFETLMLHRSCKIHHLAVVKQHYPVPWMHSVIL